MKISILGFFCFLWVYCVNVTSVWGQNDKKPRVIAMTDGEVDDRCSMVRFLLYTNDIELEAIIETNSVYQKKGWSASNWLEKQLDAYSEVYPNLKIHDRDYPSPEELRSKVFVGDEDSTHLVVDHLSPLRIPGTKPSIDPTNWKDTPGSDKIVDILLEDDQRPVHIQAWGGGNTALRAFEKLKKNFPDEYDRALSKVVMYNIWYQDGAGNYIEQHHPKVTLLLSHYFSGTWDYGSQAYTKTFVSEKLHDFKNPLGILYPQRFISEGDSPAFLYSLNNGLRSDENPNYGGWGGRFYKVNGFENVYRDISKGTYLRWIEYANRDFEARLKWCTANTYEKANHKPTIKVVGNFDRTVRSGDLVEIHAEFDDKDPLDLDALWEQYGPIWEQHGQDKSAVAEFASNRPKCVASWWQYEEAGTYGGMVEIIQIESNKIQFVAPKVTEPETIHIILEVKYQGVPSLTAFQRFIITVEP